MGHITSKNYISLQKRLDKSPQGAPASKSLFQILEVLFTKEEAGLVSVLPIKPFTVKSAAKKWKKKEAEAKAILDELADKGLLLDMFDGKKQTYIIPPTMAGFFEFSIMRTDGRFDNKVLSDLFHQYINVEEDFLNDVLALDPSIARVLVQEASLQKKHESLILDYERATKVIETASCITVGTCYCRHKMEHKGMACSKPQDVCLTFNGAAKSLAKHGIAKKISKVEAKKVLDKCVSLGLVQIGDNVQNKVAWICNCCGCCCEAILAYKRLGYGMNVKTNFYPEMHHEDCSSCGLCAKKCPVDAITMQEKNGKKYPVVDLDKCFGCGVCKRFCPTKGIIMQKKEGTAFVPKDAFERFVMTAINEGKLQNLIFDNYSSWSNQVMNRFLGIILNLSPVKRKLVSQQLQSRFIHGLSKTYYALAKSFISLEKPDYSHPELKEKN
jgi:formate hydrogenlyase subunit 6/NADH:ubiquinone oxidoreductase subunit I